MQNVELVKPPNGLRSSGASDQCGRTLTFAVVQQLEHPETLDQLARSSSEWTRPCSDFAQHGDGQRPTRSKTSNHRFIECGGREEVARDQVDRRAGRQPLVKIERFETAAIGDTVSGSKRSRSSDGHVGSIDCEHGQTSERKPHRAGANATGDVQCRPGDGE